LKKFPSIFLICADALLSTSISSNATSIRGEKKIFSYCSKPVPNENPVFELLKPVVLERSVDETSKAATTELPE